MPATGWTTSSSRSSASPSPDRSPRRRRSRNRRPAGPDALRPRRRAPADRPEACWSPWSPPASGATLPVLAFRQPWRLSVALRLCPHAHRRVQATGGAAPPATCFRLWESICSVGAPPAAGAFGTGRPNAPSCLSRPVNGWGAVTCRLISSNRSDQFVLPHTRSLHAARLNSARSSGSRLKSRPLVGVETWGLCKGYPTACRRYLPAVRGPYRSRISFFPC